MVTTDEIRLLYTFFDDMVTKKVEAALKRRGHRSKTTVKYSVTTASAELTGSAGAYLACIYRLRTFEEELEGLCKLRDICQVLGTTLIVLVPPALRDPDHTERLFEEGFYHCVFPGRSGSAIAGEDIADILMKTRTRREARAYMGLPVLPVPTFAKSSFDLTDEADSEEIAHFMEDDSLQPCARFEHILAMLPQSQHKSFALALQPEFDTDLQMSKDYLEIMTRKPGRFSRKKDEEIPAFVVALQRVKKEKEQTGEKDTETQTGGMPEQSTTSAHIHVKRLERYLEPTCMEDGRKIYACSICGERFIEPIPALGHDWGDFETISLPTCTEDGREARSCKRCGEPDQPACIPALGHVWKIMQEEATCGKDGRRYEQCSVCGEIQNDRVIPRNGKHCYDSWIRMRPVSCTIDGLDTRTCQICGAVDQKTIPAIGHTYGEPVTTVTATCESEGTQERSCLVCGKKDPNRRTLPALGHTYGAWEVTKEATCTEDGYRSRGCLRCGKQDPESGLIPSKGHQWIYEKQAPTCSVDGYEQDVCKVCGTVANQVNLPATGEHTYTHWTVTREATCTEAGARERMCRNCGYQDRESIPALGHEKVLEEVKADCENAGYRRMVCARCQSVYEEQSLPALGHEWSDWKDDELDQAHQTRYCRRCLKEEKRRNEAYFAAIAAKQEEPEAWERTLARTSAMLDGMLEGRADSKELLPIGEQNSVEKSDDLSGEDTIVEVVEDALADPKAGSEVSKDGSDTNGEPGLLNAQESLPEASLEDVPAEEEQAEEDTGFRQEDREEDSLPLSTYCLMGAGTVFVVLMLLILLSRSCRSSQPLQFTEVTRAQVTSSSIEDTLPEEAGMMTTESVTEEATETDTSATEEVQKEKESLTEEKVTEQLYTTTALSETQPPAQTENQAALEASRQAAEEAARQQAMQASRQAAEEAARQASIAESQRQAEEAARQAAIAEQARREEESRRAAEEAARQESIAQSVAESQRQSEEAARTPDYSGMQGKQYSRAEVVSFIGSVSTNVLVISNGTAYSYHGLSAWAANTTDTSVIAEGRYSCSVSGTTVTFSKID